MRIAMIEPRIHLYQMLEIVRLGENARTDSLREAREQRDSKE